MTRTQTFGVMTIAVVLALLGTLWSPAAARAESGCDPAIPDPGADQVLTNLRSWEVDAFYRTLWSLRNYYYNHSQHPWRRKLDNLAGQYIDTTTAVRTCTNLGSKNAWRNSWICLADITGTFKLKGKTQDRLRASGGGVTTVREADGDAVQFTQTVGFLWDAAAQTLLVYVRYPASTVAQNHQRTWGTYNVTALSKTRVRSSASEGSSGVSFDPFGISMSASKTESLEQSIVRATITGNPYWADTGIVVYRRHNDADSYLGLQNHWLTDAYAALSTRVDQHTAQCGSSNRFQTTLNAQGLIDGSAFNGASTIGPNSQGSKAVIQFVGADSTVCSATSEPFLAQMTFRAENAFGECCSSAPAGQISNSVGQRFLAKLHVVKQLDGKCRRSYEVEFVARVKWFLTFTAGSGDGTPNFSLTSQDEAPLPAQDFAATVKCI